MLGGRAAGRGGSDQESRVVCGCGQERKGKGKAAGKAKQTMNDSHSGGKGSR